MNPQLNGQKAQSSPEPSLVENSDRNNNNNNNNNKAADALQNLSVFRWRFMLLSCGVQKVVKSIETGNKKDSETFSIKTEGQVHAMVMYGGNSLGWSPDEETV